MDNDIKKLTSEEKNGKYDILTNILKICGIIFICLIQFLIIYFSFKYKIVKLSLICIQILALIHLNIFSRIKEYKIVWCTLIILFPGISSIIYFLAGNNSLNKKEIVLQNRFEKVYNDDIKNTEILKYQNQGIEYLKDGKEFFENLLEELKNAKKSIFIEMYIVSEGKLFDSIISILKEKVKQGVYVEIIYDSLGSIFKISKKTKKELEKLGIKLYEYKKINFNISKYINYRDHKKIIVIDGVIAYTGGINIADEYINKKELYGYWKDGGIKLYGDIVKEYLLMYLKTRYEITKEKLEYRELILSKIYPKEKGVNLTYCSLPNNTKYFVKKLYEDIINYSKKYLYIVTPYFIPSKNIIKSIKNKAREGVDVKLLVPHIPDKKIIQYANRSYYNKLIENGVKIYEYKPGFIHLKGLISDNISVIGTINLDYKSIYFNQECINISYKTGIEDKIKNDFEKCLEDSIYVDKNNFNKRNVIEKIKEKIAYFLTPLL